MDVTNRFKQGLLAGQPQIGLWCAFADAYAAELLATAGFDWLLIDNEHAPNDVRSTLGQLQAIAPYHSSAVVRPVQNDRAVIKQLLDIGAQSLLVPMVDTAEQAAAAVASTRYPPGGVRGIGSTLARASRWNHVPDYLHTAAEQICVVVQAESTAALENLAEIAAVDGVDGVFFGPSDLSASMGLLGKGGDPTVRQAIRDGMQVVRAAGKAPGVLAADPEFAREYLDAGALFVAVGSDISLLNANASRLAAEYGLSPAGTMMRDRGGY